MISIFAGCLANHDRAHSHKPHELLVVDNVTNTMNMDRMKRDEKSTNKYKTVNKLIRNEDMTREEAKKALKAIDANVLGPARNTRSQDSNRRPKQKPKNKILEKSTGIEPGTSCSLDRALTTKPLFLQNS